MTHLLVLRPDPGASRTADRARAAGFTVLRRPLFEAQAIEWTPPSPDRFTALLLTSAQAARLAGPALALYRHLPAYGVGPSTAGALAERGFASVEAGSGDAAMIVERMAQDGHEQALHLSGTAVALRPPGPLHVEEVPVYTMAPVADIRMPPLGGVVILVHSARAGARLAALVPPRSRREAHIVAISPAALAGVETGWASVRAADRPDDDDMLALAARLCD
jgi:uroporphyrinogen-III synthase